MSGSSDKVKTWVDACARYRSSLPASQEGAFARYLDDAYVQINKMLVGPSYKRINFYGNSDPTDGYTSEQVASLISEIRAMILGAPVPDDNFVLYRGMRSDRAHHIGDVVTAANFGSTSMDFEVAKRFGNIIYAINVDAGQTGLMATSEMVTEKEVLLLNGFTLEITGIMEMAPVKVYSCKLLGYN